MNRDIAAEDEMLNHTNLSVLERQIAHLKYQQHQFLNQQQPPDHHHSLCNPNLTELLSSGVYSVDPTDSVLQNGWSDSVYSGFGLRNGSSQPANFGFPAADLKVKESVSLGKMSRTTSRSESFKKRKFDRAANVEEDNKEKKIKGCVEEGEESKITAQTPSNYSKSKNKSSKKKKPNSSSTDVQKPDFIHVRARRGQATDSHSLAERVRREKISERMKYLQDLVPGCDKVTGKAGMLDEIINYVQSLQRQVEFLSMKLAAVNPRLDFNINEIFPKEVFSGSSSGFQTIGVPESLETTNPIYSQLNPLQQLVSCSGMEMVINSNSDTSLRRADDATLSIPEPFYDSSCFPSNSTWDADLQNLYNDSLGFDQGRSSQTSISLQPFAGSMAISNLKMET